MHSLETGQMFRVILCLFLFFPRRGKCVDYFLCAPNRLYFIIIGAPRLCSVRVFFGAVALIGLEVSQTGFRITSQWKFTTRSLCISLVVGSHRALKLSPSRSGAIPQNLTMELFIHLRLFHPHSRALPFLEKTSSGRCFLLFFYCFCLSSGIEFCF